MDVNQTYYGDHFTVYTVIDSLCYIPETYMLYVNLNENIWNNSTRKIMWARIFSRSQGI